MGMIKIPICFLLVIVSICAFAQKTITQRDTIHLRGKVIDENGKPLANISLSFRSHSLIYTDEYNFTLTDSLGRFLIKGANVNDTIRIVHPNYIGKLFFNNGARYVTIKASPNSDYFL